MHMKIYAFAKTAVILCVLFMITYALADGIRYGSVLGSLLALCSMAALGVVIHLSRKLAKLNSEEE